MNARQNPPAPESSTRARLKLRARDAEDLQAIAMCLQDALVLVSDIAFLKGESRFVLVANRFLWERALAPTQTPAPAAKPDGAAEIEGDARFEDGDGSALAHYERVNCGACFDGVRTVKVRGIDLKDRQRILNLLTIKDEPGAITLIFSAGAEIRLEVERVRCHLEDLGEPWPTLWRPAHDEPADAEPVHTGAGRGEPERR